MKKLITTTSAIALVALGAYAQGTISFKNINSSPSINAPIQLSDGTVATGGSYVAGLLAGTTAGNLTLVSGLQATISSGYFLGGAQTLAGIPGGSPAFLEVVAWNSSLGSFSQAQAAGAAGTPNAFGESSVFSVTTGNPTASPPTTPAFLVGLTTFKLNSGVPEPSTFALAGLGVAALLIFRRRR